ncbi:acetylpolyamine aminohydrolase [Desulfovermiculus halophilus]|jgi:acetoin utilization deacetylase AcuC-like enzyme|uniref:acetylpolyamine aminohydrolase n=1 Tax=Desulfovermiculus halophilus TaxID=339722 RepID=UPI0004812185|nr:acetylpolyamine aminohydrolase [Desulfovermiculus halophilus]
MHIVFHERYREVYASDPAAAKGRLDHAAAHLHNQGHTWVTPEPATEEDILLVHTREHLQRIQQRPQLYELALLAAGGAVTAAELACSGTQSFGLIRPPGHHASVDSCWGFCWFNNMAVAMQAMRSKGLVKTGVIVDIDLHFGDGTSGFYAQDPQITYHHLNSFSELEQILAAQAECDLVGISAGFDRHLEDWGGILSTEDYTRIGKMIKEFADLHCPGKVFSLLEGGYNHHILGPAIQALITGLEP